MAVYLYPSSYRCNCGHVSHFAEGTVREMERKSQKRRQLLEDSAGDAHSIEFAGSLLKQLTQTRVLKRLARRVMNAKQVDQKSAKAKNLSDPQQQDNKNDNCAVRSAQCLERQA